MICMNSSTHEYASDKHNSQCSGDMSSFFATLFGSSRRWHERRCRWCRSDIGCTLNVCADSNIKQQAYLRSSGILSAGSLQQTPVGRCLNSVRISHQTILTSTIWSEDRADTSSHSVTSSRPLSVWRRNRFLSARRKRERRALSAALRGRSCYGTTNTTDRTTTTRRRRLTKCRGTKKKKKFEKSEKSCHFEFLLSILCGGSPLESFVRNRRLLHESASAPLIASWARLHLLNLLNLLVISI